MGFPGFPLMCTASAPSLPFQFLSREFHKPHCEVLSCRRLECWDGLGGDWRQEHHPPVLSLQSTCLASLALLFPPTPQQDHLPSASPPLSPHLYPEQPVSSLHHFLSTRPAASHDPTLATPLFSPSSTLGRSFSLLPRKQSLPLPGSNRCQLSFASSAT